MTKGLMVLDVEPSSLLIRNYSFFASLVMLVWEILVTSRHEYHYIWRNAEPGAKCIYLFARYFAVSTQLLSTCVAAGNMFSPRDNPKICWVWFGLQASFVHCLLAVLELLLMWRVFALYRRNPWVGGLLACLFIANIINAVLFWHSQLLGITLDVSCFPPGRPPLRLIYLACQLVFTQLVIWALTLIKLYNIGMVWSVWRQVSIPTLMLRDGAYSFVGIISIFAVAVPYSYLVNSIAHIVLPLFTSILSIAICRMIMNIQRLHIETPDSDLELTTIIISEPPSLSSSFDSSWP